MQRLRSCADIKRFNGLKSITSRLIAPSRRRAHDRVERTQRRVLQMNNSQIIETAESSTQNSVTAKDGTRLFVQDWGSGRPVVFVAAWVFNSNVWGRHIAALSALGLRCVAPDRRGHGRSDVPRTGYDLDTLADDLAEVMEQLDLRDAVLVAHSMGSVKAVRYCARYGMDRVERLVLAAPTTPYLTLTTDNPEGIPAEVIQADYDAIAKDYPKWIAENEAPFFTPDTVAETRNWIKGMMLEVPLPAALACRRTFIVHGDKDASAPVAITGARTSRLIADCRFSVYEDAPHPIVRTHRERFISDILEFIAE